MLLDLRGIETGQANAVVDWLCKSVEDALADDPHPTDPLTGAMEDATTEPVRLALLRLYDAVLAMLVTGQANYQRLEKAKQPWLPRKTLCDKLEQKIMAVRPGSLTFTDYLDVIDCLILKYVREDILQNAAQTAAVKQYLVGHLRATGAIGPGIHVYATVAALPHTIDQALAVWRDLQPYDKAMIEAAQANAARLVTDLTASARSRMKKLIIEAEKRRVGEVTAAFNPQPLAQQLGEAFGDLNRDWRRVAVTETAANASDGFLATIPPGQSVRWVAHPNCCEYCRAMNGTTYQVVRATDKDKDEQTQVWAGKHVINVGRAISKRKRLDTGALVDRTDDERVAPALPAHPNCRCIWVPHVATQEEAA